MAVKYVCGKCNYKFTRKEESKAAFRCPYCGSENINEDSFDLNQVIKEADF